MSDSLHFFSDGVSSRFCGFGRAVLNLDRGGRRPRVAPPLSSRNMMQALRESMLAVATGIGAGAAGTFIISRQVWLRAQQQGDIVDTTGASMQKLRGEYVQAPRQVKRREPFPATARDYQPRASSRARSEWRCRASLSCDCGETCGTRGTTRSGAHTPSVDVGFENCAVAFVGVDADDGGSSLSRSTTVGWVGAACYWQRVGGVLAARFVLLRNRKGPPQSSPVAPLDPKCQALATGGAPAAHATCPLRCAVSWGSSSPGKC